jgi:hypothetical protein
MSEPNYNETVVVPLLQKKVQEMSNQLLFLEANMLVQQARCKWLEERLGEALAKAESASKRGKKKEEGVLDGQTY